MKKKIKLRRKIKLLLSLFLVIMVSYTTITLMKDYENDKYNFFIPTFNEKKDDLARKLEELYYSTSEIKLVKKYVSEKNIIYLVDNKVNKSPVLKIVNEPYYIDEYLEDYLLYYNNNQDKEIKDIISIVNTHSNQDYYANNEKADTIKNYFIIINKHYYVDESYPNESDLVILDSKYHVNNTETKIKKIAYDAFIKMYEEAPEDSKFKVSSAYKSYSTQEAIYKYKLSEDLNADNYTAKAGHSEHQTGYAIDIDNTNEWLRENSYKYGFILRYPENKQYLTGFAYNESHYRYCGIECATYIYENNLTYDEYYEYFVRFNNPKGL